MTILSAQSIRKRGLIEPFAERTKQDGMSYGLGPASYDVRCRETANLHPGNSALVSTIEKFTMPPDVLARVSPKSTWDRRGLKISNVVLDPGWQGHLTLRITNDGDEAIVVHAGMPLAQIVFETLDEPTEAPYVGKYSGQPAEPVAAILEAALSEGVPVDASAAQEIPLAGAESETVTTGPGKIAPPITVSFTFDPNQPVDAAFPPDTDPEPSPKAMADEDVQAVTYTDHTHAESGITTVVDPVTGDVQGWTVPALKPPSTEEIAAPAEEDGKA